MRGEGFGLGAQGLCASERYCWRFRHVDLRFMVEDLHRVWGLGLRANV